MTRFLTAALLLYCTLDQAQRIHACFRDDFPTCEWLAFYSDGRLECRLIDLGLMA